MLLARQVPAVALAPAAGWRRALQLCLAGLWVLDGVLQLQVFMFSRGFADGVADAASGNPAAIAGPVSWTSRLIGAHGALATIGIAIAEVAIGLGIAWRPTVRLALGASVAWAVGVWWLGEGLGGLLTPDANVVAGAPGAVIIYAMLAVVLWPFRRRADAQADGRAGDRGTGAAGGMAAGGMAARGLWVALWGGLAVLSTWQAAAAPAALPHSIGEMASGQPRWLAAAGTSAASALRGHGALVSLVLAGVLAAMAAAVFLPVPARRVVLGAGAVLAVTVWTLGQGFGGLLTGMATDPNSGPLLLLAIAAYWPVRARAAARAAVPAYASAGAPAHASAGVPAYARAAAGAAAPAPAATDSCAPAALAEAPCRDGGPTARTRSWVRRDIDVMNVLMAIAMASMLAGRLNPVLEVVWLGTFAAASAWFAGHAVRVRLRRAAPGQHVMHLLSCGGMLVMIAAPRAGAGAMGMAGAVANPAALVPALAAVFAVAMAGSVVLVADRLPALAGARLRPAASVSACQGLRPSCQVALGIAMACMLIQML